MGRGLEDKFVPHRLGGQRTFMEDWQRLHYNLLSEIKKPARNQFAIGRAIKLLYDTTNAIKQDIISEAFVGVPEDIPVENI